MTAAPFLEEASASDGFLANFERLAEISPSRLVVTSGGRHLSAGDLDARANRLARHLQSLGARPGTFLGISTEPCLEQIVGLLAIVKSGAAYVPLDPAYRRDLLSRMISSAGVELVLSRRNLAEAFHSAGARQVVDLLDPAVEAGPPDVPTAGAAPCDPFHAIFTCDAAGVPKAAAIFRRGLANLLDWYIPQLGLGTGDRVLVTGTLGSSPAQKTLFASLLTGARLLLDEHSDYDIHRTLKLVRDHRATVLDCTTATFHALLDAAAADGYGDLSSLRCVVLGGVPVEVSRSRPWLEHPACRGEILHTYGPAECTDICTFHRLHRGNLDDSPAVPLGREIPNVTVTIRDEDLAFLPDGEAGELCISGAGLGGGYLDDPEHTRRAFALAGGIFRSGDLARRLGDGTLEFLGRADRRATVNGCPILLGDLETRLEQHPVVKRAVAHVHNGRLIAYVTTSDPNDGLAPLRAHPWDQVAIGRSAGPGIDAGLTEWIETTAERLRKYGPRRIYEIGCGTGQLLSRLATDTECYWASDPSQMAIQSLQTSHPLPHVKLSRRPADDFSGIPDGYFDTVVIHSVAQYFPDAGYLARVLGGAAKSLKPGGRIFLGDLRSHALLAARHAEALRRHAPAGTTCRQLREQLARRLSRETELALDPAWFDRAGIPGLSHVEIQLRRGNDTNDATTYHYDVILHVGEKPALQLVTKWRQWERLNLEQLEAILAESTDELVMAGIPDARLYPRLGFLRALEHSPETGPLPFIPSPPSSALTAEQLHAVAEACGFRAHVRWRGNGAAGLLDVMFLPAGSGLLPLWPVQPTPPPLANQPHHELSPGNLAATLRHHLATSLPDHLLPAAIVGLDKIPLTLDGQVDRAALPVPREATDPDERGSAAPAGNPDRQPERPLRGYLSGITRRE